MDQPPDLEFKTLATVDTTAPAAEPNTRGEIEALVAVTGVKDEVGDIIVPGAFRRTLGERPKPKVCLGHDWNRPVGKTLTIVELMPGDSRLPRKTADGRPWPKEAGALKARWLANLDSDDGRSAYSAAKFFGPEESTFSIGYRTVRARQRGSIRYIHDLDLFEYGPVLNPANRLATLQAIKADGELTSPVDSERQDFEAGSDAVETKVRRVHDANYWGLPIGTVITPGMKPKHGDDPSRGAGEGKPRVSSFFASLPDDEQEYARRLSTQERMDYLDHRVAGDSHEEAAAKVRPPRAKPEPTKPSASTESAEPDAKPVRDKPAPKARKPRAKKLSDKQKALLLSAAPGSVTTYRRDDSGGRIYQAPFPVKKGMVVRAHANSAFPMERQGLIEAGTDGRTYILTDEGERLRAQMETADTENRTQAALGPAEAEPADANVVADAAPLTMSPAEFQAARERGLARRQRAKNIEREQERADRQAADERSAAEVAEAAPATLDTAQLAVTLSSRGGRASKIEPVGGGRLALVSGSTANWSISAAGGLTLASAMEFTENIDDPKPKVGKPALQDLADRIAALRDADGRLAPFTSPQRAADDRTLAYVRGWRDADGNDLPYATSRVVAAWAKEQGLPYRRADMRPTARVVPGGEPDAEGFRTRRIEEVAPGDEVRLPDGRVATVESNGANVYKANSDERLALTDGTKLDQDAATTPAFAYGRQISVRFADDPDTEQARRDPGMGQEAATLSYVPGHELARDTVLMRPGGEGAPGGAQEPYPAGTRMVVEPPEDLANEVTLLPADPRGAAGTLLDRLEFAAGYIFQTVRYDDGTYGQVRVSAMRSPSVGVDTGPTKRRYHANPTTEQLDAQRAAWGLPPEGQSTPLRREQPAGPDAEAPTPEAPDPEEDSGPGGTPGEPTPEEEVARTAPQPTSAPPTLPYEILRKPTKRNLTARVRYNGREYDVAATDGVDARVTVTDDDGHTATVDGGSTTLLLRERSRDRERAVREALARVEAQHGPGEPQGTPSPDRPKVPDVGKMNAQARADALRGMTDEQFADFNRAFRSRLGKLMVSRRLGDQPERNRMIRLETSVNAESIRRASEARGYPEFTDRTVLEHIGNETFDTGELAAAFGVKQPDMLRTLRRLETGGYIVRNSGEGEGDAVSGGRRRVESLGWESAAGRDGDHGAILARFDADHPAGETQPGDVRRTSEPEADAAPADVPEAEPAPVDAEPPAVEPEATETLAPELVDEAAALQDEVLGITEQPDGTIEVTEEVAARQDRVAALIEADDAGGLNLSEKSTEELTTTRGELTEELKLQNVLASRQTENKPTVLRSPAGQAERPPQRPGLAGAAEDYAEALKTGDTAAIARTRTRLQSSLRRSRVTSDTARTLADHVTGEGDDEADALLAAARGLRQETRERRNAAARRRRQARRLERVRIQSLIDKIDAELQTRARSTEAQEKPAARTTSTARTSEELREALASIERQMDRVAGVSQVESPATDPAMVNLSPNSRSRAAASAGRRRFATMDRDLARYAELGRKRDALRSSIIRAEARERRTVREANEVSAADLVDAKFVKDKRYGEWHRVRRVNATTVTVEPKFAGMDPPKLKHGQIAEVRK